MYFAERKCIINLPRKRAAYFGTIHYKSTINQEIMEAFEMRSDKELAELYQPHIYHDLSDPFPIRLVGYTVFRERGVSQSFRNLELIPEDCAGGCIVEYAVYYDYDIQHMYDLEHVWVEASAGGQVTRCWGSFHGMRLRVDRLGAFRLEGTHPVFYAEPGKHAFLPDPELFTLHDQFPACCREKAGGGLLIPAMLAGQMETSAETDSMIRGYIREHYSFSPSGQYELKELRSEQFVTWSELKAQIPVLVRAEISRISGGRPV